MPEVIDLLSSTPPHRENRPAPPAGPSEPSRPNPPLPTAAAPAPNFSFSDDSIDVSHFGFDNFDKLEPATKRQRLSEELDFEFEVDSVHRQNTATTTTKTHVSKTKTSAFQFSDDVDFGLLSPPSGQGASGVKNNKLPWDMLESDPIVFTSSAPEPAERPVVRTSNTNTNTITIDDDDDDDDEFNFDDYDNDTKSKGKQRIQHDEIEEFSDQVMPDLNELMGLSAGGKLSGSGNASSNPLYSSRTASLLASLDSQSKSSGRGASKTAVRSRKEKDIEEELSDDLIEPEPRKPARKTTTKATSADKEAKAREREAAKAQREREKQLEKERKQKLKEEKAKERQLAQDMAEVNKLKVDKKNSTPEMIIDMASSFEETSVGNQAVEYMHRLGVEHAFFESSISNIVKWRRKVTARFNESAGHWEPCAFHIRKEEHILCLVTAQDFVDMVIAPADSNETDNLEQHVLKIKSAYPDCKPIYLIEGLGTWMRKNQNSRNRAYQAEVRRQFAEQQQAETATTTNATKRGRKKKNNPETTPPIDDDTVEDALLQLQVTHACLIHHTNAAAESAEWIKNFTEHVSTIPYRLERLEGNDSAFCMDSGQVKPGEDKTDTFVKMLQEVNRVTASMAYGILSEYPTVTALTRAMRVQGPSMLEDVKKSANRTGGVTDSRIGPAASKRLYKFFTGLDPSSTDI